MKIYQIKAKLFLNYGIFWLLRYWSHLQTDPPVLDFVRLGLELCKTLFSLDSWFLLDSSSRSSSNRRKLSKENGHATSVWFPISITITTTPLHAGSSRADLRSSSWFQFAVFPQTWKSYSGISQVALESIAP